MRILLTFLILSISTPVFAIDFADTDQMYMWDVAGTAQYFPTYSVFKTEMDSVFTTDAELTTHIGTTNPHSVTATDIGVEDGATADQSATDVLTTTTNFDNNLSVADTTVQAALETLDELVGGGTDDQAISEFTLTTDSLTITLESDAGGQQTVDLSGYALDTDLANYTLTSALGTAAIADVGTAIGDVIGIVDLGGAQPGLDVAIGITTPPGTGNLAVTDDTLEELAVAVDGLILGDVNQIAVEVPFTPYSTIASTDVQGAIQEVLDEATGGTDDQGITEFTLTGDSLTLTLESDVGGQQVVDLAAYALDTDLGTAADNAETDFESATSNDFDPDRLAGDIVDDNLIDAAAIHTDIARDADIPTAGVDFNAYSANMDTDSTDDFSGVFADLTSKPTTVAGYGITDAAGASADTNTLIYRMSDTSVAYTDELIRIPTAASWTYANIRCDALDATAEYQMDVYDSISDTTPTTLSVADQLDLDDAAFEANIDISGWASVAAGAYVEFSIATTGADQSCVVTFDLTND